MNGTNLGSSQYRPFWRADHSRPFKENGEQGWHSGGRLSRSFDARDGVLATCLGNSAPFRWSGGEAKQDTQLLKTQMKKTGDFASGVRMHPGRWPVTGLPLEPEDLQDDSFVTQLKGGNERQRKWTRREKEDAHTHRGRI